MQHSTGPVRCSMPSVNASFYIGEIASRASLVKLCGNFMILSAIEALGEAMALAQKGGVPKAQLLEVLVGTLFDAPIYRNYGAIIANERFKPAGSPRRSA